MSRLLLLTLLFCGVSFADTLPATFKPFKAAIEKLTPQEKAVMLYKVTERPWSGAYVDKHDKGVYRCKLCGAVLYRSDDKFDSHCGWPSFDDAIPGAVKEIPDKDGVRTEIVCAHCGAHLGHIFRGEGFTPKNVRHCVNSLSLRFEPAKTRAYATAYFAGGCFWGVEYEMEKIEGVIDVVSGYMGGTKPHPSYYEVCRGDTGYVETVEVRYDPSKVDYETLAKRFFEIHDPTQRDGQGSDIGAQYHSIVFVQNLAERRTVQKLIDYLKKRGLDVATRIVEVSQFYPAEAYHQDYYKRHRKRPYCHRRVKRFD